MDFAALLKVGVESSSLLTAEKAMDSLADTGERTERRIDRAMDRTGDSASAAANRIGVAAGRMDGATRAATQNLTYQLSDITQMLAAGQSPFMLMMQQGDQVAGAINQLKGGPGILAGIGGAFSSMLNPVSLATFAVIGFGAYAVQWLTDTGSGVKTLSDEVDEMAKSFKAFEGFVDVALADADDLAKKYGTAAEKARELAIAQAESARATLESETKDVFAAAADPFGLSQTMKGMQAGVVADFFGMERDFLVFTQAARDARAETDALTNAVIAASNKMVSANGLQSQIAAVEQMLVAYGKAADAVDGRSATETEYISNLQRTLDKLYEQVGAEERLAARQSEIVAERHQKTLDEIAAIESVFAANKSAAAASSTRASQAVAEAQAQAEAQLGISRNAAETEVAATNAAAALETSLRAADAMVATGNAVSTITANWEAFSSIVGQDLSAISGPFADAMNQIKNSADDAAKAIPASIRSAVEAMRSISGTAGEVGRKIGAETINGLIAGIEAGRGRLQAAASGMAANINKTFRDALKIRSPSRVFRGHGQDVGEGLRLGIEDSNSSLSSTMEGLANGIGDTVGGLFDGSIRSAKDFLGSLRDMFKRTISDLVSMAVSNPIKLALGIGGGGGFAGAASAATGGGGGAGGLLGGKLLGGFGESGSIFGMGGLGGGTGLMGGLGNAISGGFGNIFNIGANAAAAGGGFLASLGAAIPVLGAVSLAFSFFKKKTELLDSGLKVTIDGMDALVETFTKTKTTRFWGLSKKTSTDTQAASKEISDPITAAFKDIRKTVIGLAGDLGLSKSRLEDFQMALTVSTKGMSQEEAQGAVMKELGKLGDGLAKAMLGGMTRFAKSGEGALDTLARLSGNLTAANDAMKALGWSTFKVKASGIGAASAMVELYGGLDKFKAATDFYFQNFYTLAERTRYTGKQFRDAIGDLGIKTVPKSIEQFRALMDRLREAGRDKAVAGLMQLAPLFMSLQDLKGQLDGVGDSATNAANRLQERQGLERRILELQGKTGALRKLELRALDPTNRALQRVIWRLEDAQGAASKAKDAFKASADAERARISELQGMSVRIRGMATSAIEATFGVSEAQRKSAESQLRLAVQTGQVWGSQLEALAETAMAVDASNFGSSLDFLRASARAAGVLASVSDAQASAAGTAEDRLETALKKYGLQDATVLSLSESMRRLDVALSRLATAEAQAIRVAAGKSAIDAPYKPTTSQGGKSAMKAEESQAAMQTELSEIKGFMRELVRISIKQERTLKEIELQGEVV